MHGCVLSQRLLDSIISIRHLAYTAFNEIAFISARVIDAFCYRFFKRLKVPSFT